MSLLYKSVGRPRWNPDERIMKSNLPNIEIIGVDFRLLSRGYKGIWFHQATEKQHSKTFHSLFRQKIELLSQLNGIYAMDVSKPDAWLKNQLVEIE